MPNPKELPSYTHVRKVRKLPQLKAGETIRVSERNKVKDLKFNGDYYEVIEVSTSGWLLKNPSGYREFLSFRDVQVGEITIQKQ